MSSIVISQNGGSSEWLWLLLLFSRVVVPLIKNHHCWVNIRGSNSCNTRGDARGSSSFLCNASMEELYQELERQANKGCNLGMRQDNDRSTIQNSYGGGETN
ncbi:hypothetical protein PIB30_044956 [Stylosanthes scabra]|uniref:Uncharacterized protein n=1 Tax=Stylosanthes scabra TaxID=79078 RepID=A0ABU6SG13_9FABA|nr:hypothetical protein [Stylosanthes scabra]